MHVWTTPQCSIEDEGICWGCQTAGWFPTWALRAFALPLLASCAIASRRPPAGGLYLMVLVGHLRRGVATSSCVSVKMRMVFAHAADRNRMVMANAQARANVCKGTAAVDVKAVA